MVKTKTVEIKRKIKGLVGKDFNIIVDGNPMKMSKLLLLLDEHLGGNDSVNAFNFVFSGNNYFKLEKCMRGYPDKRKFNYKISTDIELSNLMQKPDLKYRVTIRRRFRDE